MTHKSNKNEFDHDNAFNAVRWHVEFIPLSGVLSDIDSPEMVQGSDWIIIIRYGWNKQVDLNVVISLNIPCRSHKCSHNR